MRTIPHYVNGSAVEPETGEAGEAAGAAGAGRLDVTDPATGTVTATVGLADVELVDSAVGAAVAAFPGWRDTPVLRRQRTFVAYRALLDEHRRDVAKLVSREHGKTVDDALGEVGRGIEVVDHLCGLPELLKGEVSRDVARGVDVQSVRYPLGVCVGITPFNFPAMVPMWMFPVAIAAGNSFVLKPSERDPSASVLLAELFTEAGLPDGVLNVVHGDRVAVQALLAHPDVAAVSFVGSTPVARSIYAMAAGHGKRVQALGGAKNHLVVAPDADMDAAAGAAVSAAYGSAGERCMAVSVVVAVGDAAERVLPRIEERARALRVGPGDDPATDMGPLVTREHRDRVHGYVDRAVGEGAELVVDGRDLVDRPGWFLGPCLLDHVKPDMEVYRDEVFGPVLVVVRVPDLPAALDLVNANPYGNGAALFTESGRVAHWFQQRVTAGMVGINVPIPVPVAFHSFGGWKDSLFGDAHIYGPEGLRFYTRGQVTTSRWGDPATAPAATDLAFPSPTADPG